MSTILAEIFKVKTEFEDEFGKIHPQVLSAAERVWTKSENFYAKIIYDNQECLKILMQAAALVSQKYNSGETDIKNLNAYLHSAFRRLILAEASRQKRHSELEGAIVKKQTETDFAEDEEKICQKILINQIRARMDDWTRAVFDLQMLGYQYKDLIPKYGSSENLIRSKYSKSLCKLKTEIEGEMEHIENQLSVHV